MPKWWLLTPLFLFVVSEVKAQVVINEFSSSDTSDWVEIYNVSSNEINLSGWIIKDTASTPIHEFSEEKLPANESCYLAVSNRLNNDGDRIQLFNGTTEANCVSYGDGNGNFCGSTSSVDVTAPPSGQSASREPDGTDNWIIGSPTKSTTQCESLISTPSPTPTPIPLPSPTSSPIPTSKPTSTSKPQPQPTATKPAPTPTPRPYSSSTPSSIPISPSLTLAASSSSEIAAVLAAETTSIPIPPVTPTKNFPWVAGIFVGLGLIFLAVSIGIYFHSRKDN